MKPYILTEKAGEYVAGKRIIGEARALPIMLTDAQAFYELQIGSVRPHGAEKQETATGKARSRR